MKTETSKFKNITILYDDGNFVIARGIWDNQEEAIGARWYEEGGIGYPQTYGKPQWFIFPTDLGRVIEGLVSMARMSRSVI